jgi:putative colanic acid biosynthesis acetyltransferase WcaF
VEKTRLDIYDNSWYKPGGNFISRTLWYYLNAWFLKSYLIPVSSFRVFLLRLFGARIGKGVVIKPGVNVKYPWHLKVGDYVWIGEGVWIDNLTMITIGNNVCLSQGAMLLTGNHDYKKQSFDLMVEGITLEDGVWIGAKSLVGPGVNAQSHAVLSAQSVISKNMDAYTIYAGNPAVPVRKREIH